MKRNGSLGCALASVILASNSFVFPSCGTIGATLLLFELGEVKMLIFRPSVDVLD